MPDFNGAYPNTTLTLTLTLTAPQHDSNGTPLTLPPPAPQLEYGSAAVFHGVLCRHRAPPNLSNKTRVSLDFRMGIAGSGFDPNFQMKGVKAKHGWRICG